MHEMFRRDTLNCIMMFRCSVEQQYLTEGPATEFNPRLTNIFFATKVSMNLVLVSMDR